MLAANIVLYELFYSHHLHPGGIPHASSQVQ